MLRPRCSLLVPEMLATSSAIGVRAGGAAAPQILGNSDFLGSKRNLGKASFKRSFHGFVF